MQLIGLNKPIILWIGEFLRIGISFLILRKLLQLCGVSIAGQYLSIITVVMLIPRLLDFGAPQAIAYFSRVHKSKGSTLVRLIISHVMLATLVASIIAWLLQFFPFESSEVIILVHIYSPLLAVIMITELTVLLGISTFIPIGLYAAHAVTNLIPPVTVLVGLSILGVFMASPVEVGQLLVLFAVASMFGMIAMISGVYLGRFSYGVKIFSIKNFYQYAIHSYGSGVSKLIAQRLDRLMLTMLLSSAGYAQYSMAISVRDLCTLPANLHAQTAKNAQFDLAVNSHNEGRRFLKIMTLTWFIGALILGILLLPFWQVIVGFLFKNDYQITVEAISILAFSCAPLSTYAFSLNHLYAIRRPGLVTAISLLSLFTAITLLWGGVSLFGGVLGAAIAVTVCAFLNATFALITALLAKPLSA